MQRRDFLKSTVAVAVAAELGIGKAQGRVAAHNWLNYDFGSGPPVLIASIRVPSRNTRRMPSFLRTMW